MIDLIVSAACILLGFYLVIDSFMLATSPNSAQDKWCFKMKYIFAMMYGFCLIFISREWDSLVAAVAIFFSLWPNTFYNVIGWLQVHNTNLHKFVLSHIKTSSRRRSA